MLADTFILKVDIPYSEYWLPLAIGMVVGMVAIMVGRLAFSKKPVNAPVKVPLKVSSVPGNFDPFVQGSPSELRRTLRRGGNPKDVLYALPENKDRPVHGLVIDRSTGGLCLYTFQEFQPGAHLVVIPANAPELTPWVELEVRHCKHTGDGYEIGCQFRKTPPWSILLMFG
ncbi:MAG: PilZ domain-containing protein [Gemmataceae bacterium]|nr:PilZ domain-containing protein [Gemmataceae bacterium]